MGGGLGRREKDQEMKNSGKTVRSVRTGLGVRRVGCVVGASNVGVSERYFVVVGSDFGVGIAWDRLR